MKRLALLLPLLVVACTNDYDQFSFTDDGGSAASGGGNGGSAGTATGGAAGTAGNAGTAGTGGGSATSCQDLYGNAQGVDSVCDDQPTACELRYNSSQATCTEICQSAGGQCTDVFNNQGPCGHGQPADCNTTQFNSAICVCSK